MKTPLIGILGGMGPLAAVDLMQKMLEETAAASDQEQIAVVCWNVPQIPDRQRALAGIGASPLPAMLEGIAALNKAGATRIVVACNTAHYWFDALSAASPAPLLHIVDATLTMLASPGSVDAADRIGTVGLVATQGTLDADLYQSRLAAYGLACIVPDIDAMRLLFTPGCYAIKQGRMSEGAALLHATAQHLVERGAQRLLLACTEVPLALSHGNSDLLPICIDPTRALARACAEYWRQADRGPISHEFPRPDSGSAPPGSPPHPRADTR